MSYGLIGIGDNLRGLALSGLGAMTKEEQEREMFRAQMEQAEDAQRAQLLGTGTGIGGAYLVSNPDKAKAMWTGTKNLLGLGGSSAAPASGLATAGSQAASAPLNAGALNAIGGASGGQATGLAASVSQAASAPLNAGALNAIGSVGGTATGTAAPTGMAGAIQSAVAAPAVTPTSAAIAADVAASGAAAAEIGAGAGAAAAEGGAAAAAGSSSSLAAMAGPLAIGVAGLFLLNELFDIF